MAKQEQFIAGGRRVVCVVKGPAEPPADAADQHLLATLDILGVHSDGFVVQATPQQIARLRQIGAEVVVINQSANDYAARVMEAGSAPELLASLDKDIAKSKEDLAIAQAGSKKKDDTET